MDRIDNLIAGLVGLVIVGAFTLGLAESIGTAPFWIIVALVLAFASYDFYESCIKNGRKNGGNGNGN